jgi:hypothetical protein
MTSLEAKHKVKCYYMICRENNGEIFPGHTISEKIIGVRKIFPICPHCHNQETNLKYAKVLCPIQNESSPA